MRQTEQRAIQAYQEQFREEPTLVASAPGRVNLIGEHTDYNGGFVLPCAIDRRVALAIGHGDTQLYSDDFRERRQLLGKREESWADYPSGVVWAMREQGYEVPAFRGAFAGDVPLAGGLSSSAAIEAATALALDEFFQFSISKKDLAVLCQHAENAFVGVNSGIMDQYASLLCQAGAALFIDCRTLEATSVPLDLEGAGLSLVVCDTRVERNLAATGYNERRAMCELAAEEIGVAELRDATVGDLDQLHGIIKRRARHVITEDLRVLQAVEALGSDDFRTFGQLMYASHVSLRDDYEVSVPQLDLFVETAMASGALGARLTGAGFGGCAIALIGSQDVDAMESAVRDAYREREFTGPVFYSFLPSSGAEVSR